MKTFRTLGFIFIMVSSLSGNLLNEYTLAVSIYKLDNATQNRAKRLTLKTAKELSKTLKRKLNVIFIKDEETLLKDYINFNKYNMMLNYPSFYLQNRDKLKENSVNPFLFYNSGTQKTQYYLIANKKSKIKDISNLTNKSFSALSIDENYVTWLDYLIRKEFNTSYNNIVSKVKKVHKNDRLLLDVYFEKVDFTVVSKVVYDDISLLNPSIKKKLHIVTKSEPIFFFGLGVFHKSTPKELVDKFQEIIDNGVFNKKFSAVFRLLNMYDIQKTSFQELESVDRFYDEYLKLKRKE